MTMTYWSDREMGGYIEKRDYLQLNRLIKAGADLNGCVFKAAMGGAGIIADDNAITYAVKRKDFKLVRFMLENGAVPIERPSPNPGSRLFSPDYGKEIYEILCLYAQQRLLGLKVPVNVTMVKALLDYNKLSPGEFIKSELLNAAANNDACTAGAIFKMLLNHQNSESCK